jgi:hypothetical protein
MVCATVASYSPKRQFLQETPGDTTQKTTFFMVVAVQTSKHAKYLICYVI